jgi:hypothetical protein
MFIETSEYRIILGKVRLSFGMSAVGCQGVVGLLSKEYAEDSLRSCDMPYEYKCKL